MGEEGQTELIITFRSTHEAIMGERKILDSGINTGVMPMPVELGPGCGIALRINLTDLEKVKSLLGETIGGVYCRAGETEGTFAPWTP